MEGILTALDYIQRVRFAGSVDFMFNVLKNYWTRFESSWISFHSHHSEWRIMLSTFLSTLIIVLWFLWSIFDHSHSIGCGIVLPGFEFHFPNNQWCLASSWVLTGHLLLFFEETSIFQSWDKLFSNLLLTWIKDTMLTACLLFPVT